jgi:hypothetical protein
MKRLLRAADQNPATQIIDYLTVRSKQISVEDRSITMELMWTTEQMNMAQRINPLEV